MSRFVQIEETRDFENLAQDASEKTDHLNVVTHTENPEEILTEKQTSKDVSDAFRRAMAELGAEDRLILKLYYFDDLKLRDIGATLGFHEATASRKLVRVQTEIRKSVEKILRRQHGWSETEVRRYLSETASRLGISMEKLFIAWLALALVQEIFRSGVLTLDIYR
jgi:hypothetical protein